MMCILWFVLYWILQKCILLVNMLNVTVWSTVHLHCSQKTATKFNLFAVETSLMRKTHNRATPTIIGKTDCTLSCTNSALWENQVNNCREFKFLGRCVYPQDLFVLSVIVWDQRKSRPLRTDAAHGERIFWAPPSPQQGTDPLKIKYATFGCWDMLICKVFGPPLSETLGQVRWLGTFAKLRKATIGYVCAHGRYEFPLDGCNEILHLRIFRKTREDSSFIEIWQE